MNDVYTFFKDINSHNSPDPDGENINLLIDSDNDILNSHITGNEILKCIKNLKKKKKKKKKKKQQKKKQTKKTTTIQHAVMMIL